MDCSLCLHFIITETGAQWGYPSHQHDRPLQTCSGVKSGCEAAVHATREILEKHDVKGVLLVAVTNAFNSLNRKVALRNIKYLCLSCPQECVDELLQIHLFIPGNGVVKSREGTIQGDPWGWQCLLLPLINKIAEVCKSVYQIWFADDATAALTAKYLRQWWGTLSSWGPCFRYYHKPSKKCIVKNDKIDFRICCTRTGCRRKPLSSLYVRTWSECLVTTDFWSFGHAQKASNI